GDATRISPGNIPGARGIMTINFTPRIDTQVNVAAMGGNRFRLMKSLTRFSLTSRGIVRHVGTHWKSGTPDPAICAELCQPDRNGLYRNFQLHRGGFVIPRIVGDKLAIFRD